METLRRAVHNVLSQVGSQAVTWAATLLFTAALGRHLGDSGFGVLFLALSITALFGQVVDFGTAPLVTREVARRPEHLSEYLLHGLLLRGVLWLLSFLAIQAFAVLLDYSQETRLILTIYALTMGVSAWSGLLSSLFSGLERQGHPSLGNIIEKVLSAVVGIFLLTQGAGVVEMAWVVLLGAAARLVWLAFAVWPHLQFTLSIRPELFRSLLIGGVPFVAYGVVAQVNWRIDAVMLSKMTDEAVVGWYGAAYRLFDTLLFVQGIVAATVMMPILSRLSEDSRRLMAEDSREGMKVAFTKGLNVLLVIGIPLCAGMVTLAGPILELVYGRADFQNARPVFQVLGFALLTVYVNAGVGWTLISLNFEGRLLPVSLAAAALNIALNLLLIPTWQHVGAAAATLASELLIGVAYIALLPKWLLQRESLAVALKATLAATVMSLVVLAADGLPTLPRVVLGMMTYLVAVLLLRVLPREDLVMLQQAVRWRGATSPTERIGSV